MIIRKHDEVKNVQWGNGTSHRFLLEADGMGYTLTDTVVKAGTKSLIEYENHLEACYCIAGNGSVIEMDGTEHEIEAGRRCTRSTSTTRTTCSAATNEDMRLVCMFTPALKGDEAHDFSKEGHRRTTEMDGWTDEQKSLRKSLDPYFEQLSAGHIDDDANAVFPREKWGLIRETGVIRLPFDPEWGGLGHDALTMVYVLEHLGYGCRDAGLLFTLATQMVSMAIPLQQFGSDELKERYLRRLIDGSIISAHAISEPEAGSDATAMSTTATEDGDSYVINGKKAFCTSGPVADVITVYTTTDAGAGATGITAFVVETDNPGITVGEPIPKMGLNTSPIGELEFTDCRVPKENLIGSRAAASSCSRP